MDLGGGSKAPPSPPPEIKAFRKLITAAGKRTISRSQQKFVKKWIISPRWNYRWKKHADQH